MEVLHSLKKLYLEAKEVVDLSIRNLPLSLTNLYLNLARIDEAFLTRNIENMSYIKVLQLRGTLSYFNLDNCTNLQNLSLIGSIDNLFNFELLRNLCRQLERVNIDLKKIGEKTFKLFEGCHFPHLVDFSARYIEINILRKEFLNRFPIVTKLSLCNCKIGLIENDSFSNSQQLNLLDLSYNQIYLIKESFFSNLTYLETLDLGSNEISLIEKNSFSKLQKLKVLNLSFNDILENFNPKYIGLIESKDLFIGK